MFWSTGGRAVIVRACLWWLEPAGTVTLLFTDIEGSTRLLAELGEPGYRNALAEHRNVVREAFSRHGGYEVDTQGDSFFYAFPSATGAVGAAREAMAALEDGPIAVRVGIHTGRADPRPAHVCRVGCAHGGADHGGRPRRTTCSAKARATCSTTRTRYRTSVSTSSRIFRAHGGSTNSERMGSRR